jgi:chloramphenicol 3-O phosphotransferase
VTLPDDIPLPDLIYVNGPSSSGKTTLCRALQAAILEPFLCVGFDDFIFMSARRYYLGADTSAQTGTDDFTAQGVEMVTTSPADAPVSVKAIFGPVFRRLIDAMPAAVRALVDGGNRVIFDDVLHDRQMHDNRRHAFEGIDIFTVGVVCDVEVLEERERSRGDRVIGRARGLAEVVHSFSTYDVVVDTGAADADTCVAQILAALSVRDTTRVATADLGQVIEENHRAVDAFAKGDYEPLATLYSQRDDVTLANPFGPPARGWNEVVETMKRAAKNYRDGEAVGFDTIAEYVSSELAYILEVERFRSKVGVADDLAQFGLRVTTIFRREDGEWKIVHRHADPITSRRPAESVLE